MLLFVVPNDIYVSRFRIFIVYYINKLVENKLLTIVALLYYAFYPVHGSYSVSMMSDNLLNISISLFVVCLLEMLTNASAFFKSRFYSFIFILSGVIMSLIRNNGIFCLYPYFTLFILLH